MVENNLSSRLNKRVEIQYKVAESDGFGGYVNNWIKLKDIWCEIKSNGISTSFKAKK